MKTTIKSLAAIFCTVFLMPFNAFPQFMGTANEVLPDSTLCLEMKGKILKNGKSVTNTYTVELLHDNSIVASAVVKDNRSFRFNLTEDTFYAIKIYKKGYATKLISICTTIPETKFKNRFFRFHFKTKLIHETEFEKLNEESKDFPIALVSFNKMRKSFHYNEKYTFNIKRSLYNDITVPKY